MVGGMIDFPAQVEQAPGTREVEARPADWKVMLRADLGRTLERGGDRWSRAVKAVAWIHLLCFLACQALYDPNVRSDPRLVLLWAVELATVLTALRVVVGAGWFRSSPSIGVVTRLWSTFLILSFNLVMLNALTGWESRWYKPAWGTLSTFFFAALAWLFTPRFFIPAVQMYFTALLMVRFKDYENLIYGVSWWFALLGIASAIRRPVREERGDPILSVSPPAITLATEAVREPPAFLARGSGVSSD